MKTNDISLESCVFISVISRTHAPADTEWNLSITSVSSCLSFIIQSLMRVSECPFNLHFYGGLELVLISYSVSLIHTSTNVHQGLWQESSVLNARGSSSTWRPNCIISVLYSWTSNREILAGNQCLYWYISSCHFWSISYLLLSSLY